MNLPIPEYGANDKETIANLMDTVVKLRKELEYLMYHLGDANIPDLAGMKGDIKGNHSLILQAEDEIQLLVTDVAGNTSTINLHSNQIALLVTDVNENTSAITQQADQIALLVTDVAGHTSTLTVQAGQIQSLVTTTGQHTSSITQLSNQITLKVDANGIISAINLSPEAIDIQASKINLVGAVSVLSDITGNLGTITSGNINISENVSIGDRLTLDATDFTSGVYWGTSGTNITYDPAGHSLKLFGDVAVIIRASAGTGNIYIEGRLELDSPTNHNIVAKFG